MTNPNDRAEFPLHQNNIDCWCGQNFLTKREYFAGIALNACIQRIVEAKDMQEAPRAAVAMADALITELSKEVGK